MEVVYTPALILAGGSNEQFNIGFKFRLKQNKLPAIMPLRLSPKFLLPRFLRTIQARNPLGLASKRANGLHHLRLPQNEVNFFDSLFHPR